MSYKCDFSEKKVAMNFFETFPECSLPSTVLKKKKKKMIGQWWANLTPFAFMPVLVLIMHVIHRSTLHFAVA